MRVMYFEYVSMGVNNVVKDSIVPFTTIYHIGQAGDIIILNGIAYRIKRVMITSMSIKILIERA